MSAVALLALLAAAPAQAPGVLYVLELEGEVVGEFSVLELGRAGEVSMRVEDGATVGGALERWWGELGDPDAPLAVGENRRDGDRCRGRSLVARQRFGRGLRRRQISHTLIDACPVRWDVEALEPERTRSRSITFAGRGLGIER